MSRPKTDSPRCMLAIQCIAWIMGATCLAYPTAVGAENDSTAPPPRAPWTISRVLGTPDPPPLYSVEPAFTKRAWKQPVFAIREPGSEWLVVVEWPQPQAASTDPANQAGDANPGPRLAPAQATRVLDRAEDERTESFLELADRAIYCLEFHPLYRENGHIYVCSKTHPQGGTSTNILSRFIVSQSKKEGQPACDPATEVRILEWPSDGHDGGAVVFGHDGLLYVSVGDGSGDSDDKLTAQDASTILGKILRIDVDHPAAGMPYAIPRDNPFVHIEGARHEIWSLGHRNPWRMTVDAKTGGLWVGNNGQDLWEFAHLIERGDNCGWSVYEGSHPFYLNRQQGPGRIAPPTVEHDHGVFRSMTGGVVYYGHRFPGLEGAYIYGDYSTGAIWGVHHDGKRVNWNRELAKSTLDIVGFATSHRGELLVVDYASGLYRLVESPPDDSYRRFPRKLSETGLFASVATHQPAPGVVPYIVAAPAWTDGASAERLVALPGESRIERPSASQWEFPEGAVLVQTLSLPRSHGAGTGRRRIETRLLTKQTGVWAGYSYIWNDAQDEATLAPAEGAEFELSDGDNRSDAGQGTVVQWKVPSRTDCLSCHSRAANFILGLSDLQANCQYQRGAATVDQMHELEQTKVIGPAAAAPAPERPKLVNPYDVTQELEPRVRSYLHANCSVCHVTAGGGNSRMLLNLEQKRDEMQLVGAFPQHQTFGIPAALLVASGEPERSVLFERLSRRGPGQMPPRGVQEVDRVAVEMMREWITRLPPPRKFVKEWALDEVAANLEQLDQGRSHATGARLFKELGCGQCHRFGGTGGGAGPDLSQAVRRRSRRELVESILEPSKQIAPEFASTIVVTNAGKSFEGRIVQEDDQKIVLQTADSLAKPITVRKDEIEKRFLSPLSTMPLRLMDTLEISEILDLLAYLVADANPEHPAFSQ